MRARYYSPELRRFINADIIPGEISNAVTLNRYAYANGNPVSNVDPFGLSAEDKTKGTSQSAIIPEVGCSDDVIWSTLANYFGSAWDDVKSYIVNLYEYGLKRRSQEMIEDFNLYTFTNWLTLGLVEGLDIRSQAMLNDPNLYTVSNWLTFGAVDSIKGAFNPDKPLSVQHWVDSFNTVCILLPITYKSIEAGTSALNRLSAKQQAPVTLNPADVKRIQNATNKTGQQIIVVGSRANGTATVFSDWDYYMTGNSAQRHAAISSLPRGIWGGQNNTGIDVYVGYPNSKYYEPLITSKPHIIFSPKE